ncbi:hypothetical protein HDU93_009482 [Gonapodya sp. JEL0774]|nr:hypothetical protein HDU93_009482 [Gonapodya sp. JEL0774]
MDDLVREARINHDALAAQFHRSNSRRASTHGFGGKKNRAMGLSDIPYYVVGPFIRFAGVDSQEGVWRGTALVLVRTAWDGSLIPPPQVVASGAGGGGGSLNDSGSSDGKSWFDRFSSKRKSERHQHRDSQDEVGHHVVGGQGHGTLKIPLEAGVDSGVSHSKATTANSSDGGTLPKPDGWSIPKPISVPPPDSVAAPAHPTPSKSKQQRLTAGSFKQSYRPVLIVRETLHTTTTTSADATNLVPASVTKDIPAQLIDQDYVNVGEKGDSVLEPVLLEANMFGFSAWRFHLRFTQDPTSTKKIRYRMVLPDAPFKLPASSIGESVPGPMRMFTDPSEMESTTHDWKNWHTFYVPGKETRVRAAFFTCNGFAATTKHAGEGTGIPTMWSDVIRVHTAEPFHFLIGGGDQIYNDDIFNFPEQPINRWMNMVGKSERERHPWTPEMDEFARGFYFRNYCMHFMTSPFEDVLRSIPHIFNCDDHDFFDGFGSYPPSLHESPVFTGIGRVALRHYLLFQHHTTPFRAKEDGFFPATPTPDGASATGFNVVLRLSSRVVLVAVDSRTERTKEQVFKESTWALVNQALAKEGRIGMDHLLFGNPVPMIFGDIGSVEGIMERISQALNSNSLLHRIVDKLGLWRLETLKFGEPQFLDDCVDHWTSRLHIRERNTMLRDLTRFAQLNTARVTILTGDVHCCGVGRLRSSGVTTREQEASDPKTIYQVISSAICNDPPPSLVVRWMFEGTDRPPKGVFSHEDENGRIVFLPGDEIVVGKVTEGLIRMKELQRIWSEEVHGLHRRWGAKAGSGTGDKIGFRDRSHLKHVGKQKLLRHRNWCEITELPARTIPQVTAAPTSDPQPSFVPADETPRHLPSRLEFILHCEREREFRRLKKGRLPDMNADPQQWALQMSALQKDRIDKTGSDYPETNTYGLVVPGLSP